METKKSRPQAKKKTVRKQLFEQDVLRAVTTEFIRNRERFYSPQIARNIVNDLRAQLIQGIDAGDRISDLQARVRRVLVNDAPSRISRIIRTEINAGMNAGAVESYKATAGRVSRKKWLTAGDALVRGNRPGDLFNHKQAHGQVVKVADPFIVGGERLQHPGDPSGSPANIIRCRCTTVPILLGQRLPRAPAVVVPARLRPDAPGRPAPAPAAAAQGPGQPGLPGFTEAGPSVPQSIAPGAPATALTVTTATEGSLINSPALSKRNLGGGANTSQIHTLEDGTKGVFKPKKGERRLRSTINKGTYYQREAAAYDVSKVMGVDDLVPVTVQRTDNLTGDVGSLQEFVKGKPAHMLKDPFDGPKDHARAAAYDYAIGQTDRHRGNWLIGDEGPRKGKFVLIDNGLAFPKTNKTSDAFYSKSVILNASNKGLQMPQELVRKWRDNFDEIEQALVKNGIEPLAIDAMRERVATLAEMGDFAELVSTDPALGAGRQN